MDSLGRVEGVDYDVYTTSATYPPSYTFPDSTVLSTYTSVLFLSEQDLSASPLNSLTRLDAGRQRILQVYLDIGGKLLFSGPPNIPLLFGTPTNNTWAIFANEIFHIVTEESDPPTLPFIQNEAYDFIGSYGKLGYPATRVDTTKLPSTAGGAMKNIALNYPRGFGQTISEFDSRADSITFEHLPLGVRYLAPPPIGLERPTYSVVYFGQPLYYLIKSDVIAVLRKAFEDIQE
jgi:hypothetical protein